MAHDGWAVLAAFAAAALLVVYVRGRRARTRSRNLAALAARLGLSFDAGRRVHDALRHFAIAENEYAAEVADRMHGRIEDLEIAAFDFFHHRSPHSGNPPYRETIVHGRSEPNDRSAAAASATRFGYTFEVQAGHGAIVYRPGVQVKEEEMETFLRNAVSVLKS